MKNLSDFWRARRSYNRTIELKTILEDLKAFIEMAADEGDFDVSWGEFSQHEGGAKKKVVLSYLPLESIPAPFAGNAVDVVAGFAAHEAGHRIRDQRGQAVRQLNSDERPGGMTASVEGLIRNILEDVYIDHYLYANKAPVLGAYIKHGRDWDTTQTKYTIDSEELKMKAEAGELSKLDVLKLWIKYELYGFNSAEELKDFPDSVLETLLNLAQITDMYCRRKGLVDAVAMYESIWGEIKGYAQPATEGSQSKQEDGEGGGGNKGVSFEAPSGTGKGEPSESEEEDSPDDDDGDDESNSDNSKTGEQDDESDSGKDDEPTDKPDTGADEQADDFEIEELLDEVENGIAQTLQNMPPELFRPNSIAEKEKRRIEAGLQEDAEVAQLYDDALPCQNRHHDALPESLAQDIKDAIVHNREDITQAVREEFKQEGFFDSLQNQRHTNIIVEKGSTIILPTQDDAVSRSIKAIFNFRKRRRTRHSRGTEEGVISQTRLYRAGMADPHLYEKRDIKDNLDINVCILCDMSSSVVGSQDILGQCVKALALGLSHRRGVKVCALAYNSPGFLVFGNATDNVQIHRLFESGDKEVGFCKADGGTPTVAAMGAVPGLMRRLLGRARDNLLIHITDGFAHDEAYLKTNIEDLIKVLAKKHKIDTYCLAILNNQPGQKALLEKAYGKSFERLDSYEQLPDALTRLLFNLLVTS